MNNSIFSIHIAYGSETGNAQALAHQLFALPFLASFDLNISTLNELDFNHLNKNTLLIIISSSYGDGNAPANAEVGLEKIIALDNIDFKYCIFGIGDSSYPNFNGFSKTLTQLLHEKSAPVEIHTTTTTNDENAPNCIIETVYADLNYQEIFDKWSILLEKTLLNLPTETVSHKLSTVVYNEKSTFPAQILQIEHLAASSPPVYHIQLDLKDSGIQYQIGDLIYVKVTQPDDLLNEFCTWFNDQNAQQLLHNKELRLLSKSVLREINKICNHEQLAELLKISNKSQLEQFLFGHDVLDVLRLFDHEKTISLMALAQILSPLSPRAYSISSSPCIDENRVDLCVREVQYQLDGRQYFGTASHHLAQRHIGDTLQIFAKPNPTFHLPQRINVPLILICAGTGIAPFIGFLQQLQCEQTQQETYLFFGERHAKDDFLYESELNDFLKDKTLTQLFTAFSRDQAEKIYVQDQLWQQRELIWNLLNQGAYVYLCGRKSMGKAVEDTLIRIAQEVGQIQPANEFDHMLIRLMNQGRFFKDVY